MQSKFGQTPNETEMSLLWAQVPAAGLCRLCFCGCFNLLSLIGLHLPTKAGNHAWTCIDCAAAMHYVWFSLIIYVNLWCALQQRCTLMHYPVLAQVGFLQWLVCFVCFVWTALLGAGAEGAEAPPIAWTAVAMLQQMHQKYSIFALHGYLWIPWRWLKDQKASIQFNFASLRFASSLCSIWSLGSS